MFLFHYSGHGGQLADRTGDEMDFEDDCIFPVDSIALKGASQHDIAASRRNIIINDDLRLGVVSPLAPGVRLTAVFDSCHTVH